MTKDQAIEKVTALLIKYGWPEGKRPKDADVTIHAWADECFRVAEVAFVRTRSGSSFMQNDPDAGAVLFTVERAVLALMDGEYNTTDKREACWRMIRAACGETAAKRFQRNA